MTIVQPDLCSEGLFLQAYSSPYQQDFAPAQIWEGGPKAKTRLLLVAVNPKTH